MTGGWAIRPEQAGDERDIGEMVGAAFAPMPFSDGSEVELVERLRRDGDLVLSLVAEEAGTVIGHIGFNPIVIGGRDCGWFQLSPLAVRPGRQRMGVGTALVEAGLAEMRRRGAAGIGVEGDPGYYERFGFVKVEAIAPPPPHAAYYRALLLAGEWPRGEIRYAPAFY